jgi:hypothetical protein
VGEGKTGSTMSGWMRFVVAVLATWRVTHLLASEDGPADLIVKFRRLLGHSLAGQLMDCFYCLSLWIAAPAALFISLRLTEWLFSWLAISGGACLLERMVKEPVDIQPMPPPAEGDTHDVLWSEAYTAQGKPDTKIDREHTPELPRE